MIRLHPNPQWGWMTFTIGWNKTCTVVRCLLKSGHITLGALLTLSLLPLLSSYLVSMWMENLGRKEHWEDRGNDGETWKIPQKVYSFLHFTMDRAADQISARCHFPYFILWDSARNVLSFAASIWGETPWRLFLRYHNWNRYTDRLN